MQKRPSRILGIKHREAAHLFLFLLMALTLSAHAQLGPGDGWTSHTTLGRNIFDPAKSLLANAGFEHAQGNLPAGWSVSYRDGAEGQVELVRDVARSGKHALKITKTNARGFILVSKPYRFKGEPIPLALNGFYRVTDADPLRTISDLRIEVDDTLRWEHPTMDFGYNEPGTLLTTAEGWERRTAVYKRAPNGDQVRIHIIAAGNPHTVWWDDLCLENYQAFASRFWDYSAPQPVDYGGAVAPESSLETLKRSGEVRNAKLVRGETGLPHIAFRGGKHPVSLLTTLTFEEGQHGGRQFSEAGVNLQSIILPEESFLQGKGQMDCSVAIDTIKTAIRAAPDAGISLTLQLNPYRGFLDDFPEDAWINHAGEKAYGHSIHVRGFGENPEPDRYFHWPSYFSENFRDAMRAALSNLISELEAEGLMKNVVGFHVAGGHDGQFSLVQLDYSPPAKRAFAQWLRKKYGSDRALAEAWGDTQASFAGLELPQLPQTDGLFYDPSKHRAFVDFYTFSKQSVHHNLEVYADHLRKLAGKEIFTIRWCQEALSGTALGALDLNPFTYGDAIDAICAQPSYSRRLAGVPYSYHQPFKSYTHNGRTYISEMDSRTYASNNGLFRRSAFGPGYISRAEDFPAFQATTRKILGKSLAELQGYWWFDIGGGMFNDRQILEDIATIERQHREMLDLPMVKKADVVLVQDEASLFWTTMPNRQYVRLPYMANNNVPRSVGLSGVPFDIILMEDLIRDFDAFDDYKVYVFINASRVTPQRQQVFDRLKGNNRKLVWMHAAGYVRDSGLSLDGIEGLTGFAVELESGVPGLSITAKPTDHPYSQGLSPEQSPGHTISYRITLDHPGEAGYWGGYWTPEQFAIHDTPGMTVLGRYTSNNNPAIAVRDFGDWQSIYIGQAGALSPELLHNIAAAADAYIATTPGIEVSINSHFACIHAVRPGRYTIRLPRIADVINLKTGEKIASATDRVELETDAKSVYWLRLDDPVQPRP
ncbi:MAG: beta-galactosidase [Planctomycetota bacterium]